MLVEGQEGGGGFPSLWVGGQSQAQAVGLLVLLAALQREADRLGSGAGVAVCGAGGRRGRGLGSNWAFFCVAEDSLARLLLVVQADVVGLTLSVGLVGVLAQALAQLVQEPELHADEGLPAFLGELAPGFGAR